MSDCTENQHQQENKENTNNNKIKKKILHVNCGMDFGTTRSVIAVCQHEQISNLKTIPLDGDTAHVIPSVIFFGKNGVILIGSKAKAKQRTHPESTFYDLKRFQGQTYVYVRLYIQ